MLGTVYEILKDILTFVFRRFKKTDPVVLLEQRQKWRSEFQEHLKERKGDLIYGEAIIRDISRIDGYPEISEKRNEISPWFRVEVKGLYHRGIEVIIGIHSLVYIEHTDKWKYSQDVNGNNNTLNAFLVGQISFDVIRSVEWRGDEYYPIPHIYCKFTKKQPYENLVYYELQGSDEHRYFQETVNLDDVIKQRKHGIQVFRKSKQSK